MAQLVWQTTQVPGGPSIDTSLTRKETDCLAELAHGARVLEVGSGYGYSSIIMCKGGANHVLCVDPHAGELADSFAVMARNLAAHGVEDRVSRLVAPSQRALPVLSTAGAEFDLIFVDGNHDVAVHNDVRWAIDLCAPSGYICVHDYGEDTFPEIIRVLDEAFPQGPDMLVDTLFVIQP